MLSGTVVHGHSRKSFYLMMPRVLLSSLFTQLYEANLFVPVNSGGLRSLAMGCEELISWYMDFDAVEVVSSHQAQSLE